MGQEDGLQCAISSPADPSNFFYPSSSSSSTIRSMQHRLLCMN